MTSRHRHCRHGEEINGSNSPQQPPLTPTSTSPWKRRTEEKNVFSNRIVDDKSVISGIQRSQFDVEDAKQGTKNLSQSVKSKIDVNSLSWCQRALIAFSGPLRRIIAYLRSDVVG